MGHRERPNIEKIRTDKARDALICSDRETQLAPKTSDSPLDSYLCISLIPVTHVHASISTGNVATDLSHKIPTNSFPNLRRCLHGEYRIRSDQKRRCVLSGIQLVLIKSPGQTGSLDKAKDRAENQCGQATESSAGQPLPVAHDSSQLGG